MAADTYQILSILFFCFSGVFLIAAIVLSVKFGVFSLIGELSGKTAAKQVAEIRRQNKTVHSRKSILMENEIKRKADSDFAASSMVQRTAYPQEETQILEEETQLLVEENRTFEEETQLLGEENRTFEEGTQLLSEEIPVTEEITQPLTEGTMKLEQDNRTQRFHIIYSAEEIHTDEII